MTEKTNGPQSPAVFKWAGVQRISGFGVRFESWNVGSICRTGTKVCEELRKRKMDVCCIQKAR